MAPELKKERTTEKDRLRRTTLQHPRAQAPVRARKNRVAPTDLGHGVCNILEFLQNVSDAKNVDFKISL
jgi:hypothetical protein